jgi:hypothetical protein
MAASLASGSVVDSWLSLERVSQWKCLIEQVEAPGTAVLPKQTVQLEVASSR